MSKVTVEYKQVEVTLVIDLATAEKLMALLGGCPYGDRDTFELFDALGRAGVRNTCKLIAPDGGGIPVINFKKV